jgi:hypothetical protein
MVCHIFLLSLKETFSDNLVDKVVLRGATIDDELEDVVPELKEYMHISESLYSIEFTKMVVGYLNVLKTPGPPPSQASKLAQYYKSQGDINQMIFNGQRGQDSNFSTIALSIQMFHPIFDEFLSEAKTAKPTHEDLSTVYKFMCSLQGL